MKKPLLPLFICLLALPTAAQQYSRSADLDPEIYNSLLQRFTAKLNGKTAKRSIREE